MIAFFREARSYAPKGKLAATDTSVGQEVIAGARTTLKVISSEDLLSMRNCVSLQKDLISLWRSKTKIGFPYHSSRAFRRTSPVHLPNWGAESSRDDLSVVVLAPLLHGSTSDRPDQCLELIERSSQTKHRGRRILLMIIDHFQNN